MAIETVAVAGGSGAVGSTVIDQLIDEGYRTVSLDVQRLGEWGDSTTVNRKGIEVKLPDEFRRTDLLDPGEIHGALAASGADAVIHVGTITNSGGTPWQVCYENNVMTTFNLLDAARNLGLESVAVASSISAIGMYFAGPPPEIDYLPLDEDHRATPSEPYGLSKRVAEVTGAGMGRLDGSPRTISTVRFAGVHGPDDVRRTYVDADRSLAALRERYSPGDNPLFAYLHVEDAASILRHAIEADFEGHETFWAAAADTNADAPTRELVEAFYPDAELRGEFDGHESLISTEKARDLLGWEPSRSCRDDA